MRYVLTGVPHFIHNLVHIMKNREFELLESLWHSGLHLLLSVYLLRNERTSKSRIEPKQIINLYYLIQAHQPYARMLCIWCDMTSKCSSLSATFRRITETVIYLPYCVVQFIYVPIGWHAPWACMEQANPPTRMCKKIVQSTTAGKLPMTSFLLTTCIFASCKSFQCTRRGCSELSSTMHRYMRERESRTCKHCGISRPHWHWWVNERCAFTCSARSLTASILQSVFVLNIPHRLHLEWKLDSLCHSTSQWTMLASAVQCRCVRRTVVVLLSILLQQKREYHFSIMFIKNLRLVVCQ